MGDDCVPEFYGNSGSTVHLFVIFCPIKSRHPPRGRPTIAVFCLPRGPLALVAVLDRR